MTLPSIPNPLPDHSSEEYANSVAGQGQPLYVEQVGQNYFQTSPTSPVYTDESSLAPGKYLLGLTMNRIYKLLSTMIASLQNVAVAQSGQLNVLTDWQAAYNSKKNSVHSFIQSNGDAFKLDSTASTTGTLRQDLNNANANYTAQLQANSNIVSDQAKQVQTQISQTQDAVNTQANMATSLVQQFQTILSSIYQ